MGDETRPGRSLERFVRERWRLSGGKGGIRGLCAKAGVTPESLYGWFRGDGEPGLGSVAGLASALNVSRAEIVAALDGYDWEAARRAQVAEEIAAAVGPIRALMREAGLLPAATAPDEAVPEERTPRARVA